MKQFIDGCNSPAYFVDDAKYYIKHKIREDYFEHEFKCYYKNCNRYFVGIGASNLVIKITAQDYSIALENKRIAEERVKSYLLSASKIKERLQLTLF